MKTKILIAFAMLCMFDSFALAQQPAARDTIYYGLDNKQVRSFIQLNTISSYHSLAQEDVDWLISILIQEDIYQKELNKHPFDNFIMDTIDTSHLGLEAEKGTLLVELAIDGMQEPMYVEYDDVAHNIFIGFQEPKGRKKLKVYEFEAGLTPEGAQQMDAFFVALFHKYQAQD